MDRTVRERFVRIIQMADLAEDAADHAEWDSALVHAIKLNSDAAFIVDWLRGQSEYRFIALPAAGADTSEPTADPSLGNVSEPFSGTKDTDLPVGRG